MNNRELQRKHEAVCYLQTNYWLSTRISKLYDDDEDFRDALHDCMPGLEYPDISHLTLREFLEKAA